MGVDGDEVVAVIGGRVVFFVAVQLISNTGMKNMKILRYFIRLGADFLATRYAFFK